LIRALVQFLRVTALALWVGGIFFFAIGVAPVAFRLLASEQAGEVVRLSLHTLHVLGFICGILALACSGILRDTRRGFAVCVAVMIFLTTASEVVVTPKIEQLRANRQVQTAEFSRWHQASTSLEAAVLVFGLLALYQVGHLQRRER